MSTACPSSSDSHKIAEMADTTVLSVGGSIVAPDGVDTKYVRAFCEAIKERLDADESASYALVVGGGSAARSYQAALREVAPQVDTATLDLVGIAATRLNAAFVSAALGAYANGEIITDPTVLPRGAARVHVSGGWKPGFSTDNVAVTLAATLGATTMINLSNIKQIYSADPSLVPDAKPLDMISWDELIQLVGSEWVPGANTPFDPVATRRAASLGMTVITADGRDLENLANILDGSSFIGTTIRPA